MADNKQYIVQVQNNGSVLISEDVIATIVAQSVKEVESAVSLSVKPGADIADMIGKKNWGRGIKILIDEDNSVSVDCNILVGYGQNITDMAKTVQESIFSHLEAMTGVKVKAVNVSVCGILRQ